MVGPSADSVSQWLSRLKSGDPESAQRLWERYSARILKYAKSRLAISRRRVADEEDVVASVFESLFQGATDGRFARIQDRDALWWMLLTITKRKAIDQLRREGARKRADRGTDEDEFVDLEQLVGDDPTPEFLAMLEEEHQRLLSLLRNEPLRKIAALRIEGYLEDEIAAKLGTSLRTVERKLALIRAQWAEELGL